MRRVLAIAAVLVVAATFAVLGTGASDDAGTRYSVEVDNAFGLIEGGDLKVAGVRAGSLTDIRLDRRTKRAIVGFTIDRTGFGGLKRDARCEVRPQSLIGEYYLDCLPGTARERLPAGGRIPVERTSSTVPPDLVFEIMRRPQRERFSLILSSLGAGVAGNAERLNETIRRAVPALRETDEVLARLAKQDRVLADLARDAATVVGDLAENRRDVGRFVTESRETAQASAERRDDIAAGFRRLPGFLRELRATMPSLGRVAARQGPALQNLAASADVLEQALDRLGPFAEASRPAVRTLGEAAVVGRRVVRKAEPVVTQLSRSTPVMPELARNLAIVFEHLDDRDNAWTPDPRSPEGKGYTGIEALLQYVFDQTASINVHDGNHHILKVAVFESDCAPYTDARKRRSDHELTAKCSARLGPYAPGLDDPDKTEAEAGGPARAAARARVRRADGDREVRQPLTPAPEPVDESTPTPPPSELPGERPGAPVQRPSAPPTVLDLPNLLPRVLAPGEVRAPDAARAAQHDGPLLDYLFGR